MLQPSSQPDPKARLRSRPQAKPRRVVAGVRLTDPAIAASSSWLVQRWLKIVDAAADSNARIEGLEYARLGQTRRLDIGLGMATAVVQGRSTTPYQTILRFSTVKSELWDAAERAMAAQAGHAARLMTGEVHPDLEAMLAPLGIDLMSTDTTTVETTCSCRRPPQAWCKHACCAAFLLAEKLSREPLTIFALRGLAAEELLDRIRHRRSASAANGPAAPIHLPHVPGVSDLTPEPLESCVDRFWHSDVDPADLDFAAERPEVSHPLLRRLGASPFERGRFPLVGLLATCYEVNTEAALAPETRRNDES